MSRLLYSAQCNIFFSHHTIFQFICLPSPSKLGRQPCWVACLLVCVSGLESEVKAKSMKVNKRDVDIKHFYIDQL
jgi:hypothetical protein